MNTKKVTKCCGVKPRRAEKECRCTNESQTYCDGYHHGYYTYCPKCLERYPELLNK